MNQDERRALAILKKTFPMDDSKFAEWCEKNRQIGEKPQQIADRFLLVATRKKE